MKDRHWLLAALAFLAGFYVGTVVALLVLRTAYS
jgi:uncharacterized membrane-anchored protein YhcB (DUF1043 family)